MNVLIVEPGKAPRESEIGGGLNNMQEVVGGLIQAVYPYEDPVAVVCNDEGKILGMPLNRALRDESGEIYDILAGTFFICGLGEDNFASLSPELMKKYKEKFAQPEIFMKMGDRILSLPAEPERITRPPKRDVKMDREER
jgi:hypothetical protein